MAKKKSPTTPVKSLLQFFQFPRLRAFFAVRKNLIATLVVVVLFGLAYLFKDVFIVAVVNGKPIFRWTVVEKLEEQGGAQVLDSLITETLVKQAIKDAGVTVSQADIDGQLKQIEDRLSAQGLTLDQALAQEGITKASLVNDITLQRSAEQMVADKVSVSDAEIDAYIKDNQATLPTNLKGDDLRAAVKQQLYSTKLNDAIQQWVTDLHSKAKILYLKQYASQLTPSVPSAQ